MTRLAAALAAAALLAGCGGPTGINVRIEVPVGFPPEEAFDSIKVEVINRDQEVFSQPPFPVFKGTELPYRVLVWLGEEPQDSVTIDVKLMKTGQLVKQKRCPGVTFIQGRLRELAVDLASSDDCSLEP